MAVTPQTISGQIDKIEPVRWHSGTGSGVFGMHESERLKEIAKKFGRERPSHVEELVPELKSISADETEFSGARYEALGYLVALQNRGKLNTGELIVFLEELARASTKPSQWERRRDALCAMAHLKDLKNGLRTDRQALTRLMELAKDPGFGDGRRDVLLALGMTHASDALEPLASGIIQFGELNELGQSDLADAVKNIVSVPWLEKARCFVYLLQGSSRQRNEIHATAILQAIKPLDEQPRHTQEVEDFLIGAAVGFERDDRMSGILAELITACEGGNSEQAGHRINAYQRNHSLPSSTLHNLRVQMGGTPALSGVMTILKTNLDKYFQEPIHQLNEDTRNVWQKALENATTGFVARLWMSITVFALGVVLVALSSYEILFGAATTRASLISFAAGLGTMLLIVYVGPLKDIRQSVNDLASANAAFMAYVHRILETSHTFSYYYLTERISFEELLKSSQIIKEAMNNTIGVLNTRAVDSSEDVIRRAVLDVRDQEKGAHMRSAKELRSNIQPPEAPREGTHRVQDDVGR